MKARSDELNDLRTGASYVARISLIAGFEMVPLSCKLLLLVILYK